MKWAPNKKLHFEIALIKAIQTLGQTTLTEVIDALATIREAEPASDATGTARNAEPRREARQETTTIPTNPAAALKRGMDWASLKRSVAQPTAAPPPAEQPKSTAKASQPPPPAPVVPAESKPEPAPVAVAAPVEPEQRPEPGVGTPTSGLDGPRLWRDMIQEIRSLRPLITAWVQVGRPLSVEGNTLRVGFPLDQRMSVDSLNKPNTRKFLESLLTRLAGQPVAVKLELTDESPALPPSNGDHPAPAADGSAPQVAQPAPTVPAADAASDDPTELFKNDPLIQKALKIFEGEIRSVQGPA